MIKREFFSMEGRPDPEASSHMRIVHMPIEHQGIMDALRRAYEEPISEPTEDFERLLARLQ